MSELTVFCGGKVGRSTADLAFAGNTLAHQVVKPAVKRAENALFSSPLASHCQRIGRPRAGSNQPTVVTLSRIAGDIKSVGKPAKAGFV